MRRTLAALVTGAALVTLAPAPASATHSCHPAFWFLCFATCPAPPKICPIN